MATYTEEQRADALRLYVDEGPDVAAEQTGISVRTIYRWASAEGVSTTAISEKTQAATTAAKARAAMVREEVRALLVEQAAKVLHEMNGSLTILVRGKKDEGDKLVTIDTLPASDKKDLAITAATLIDKYRLEEGEATGRTETRTWTDGLDPDKQRALRDWALNKLDQLDGRERSEGADSASGGSGVRQPTTGDVL